SLCRRSHAQYTGSRHARCGARISAPLSTSFPWTIDTSTTVQVHSSPDIPPDRSSCRARLLERLLPRLLIEAASSGLGSTPASPSRGASPHLSCSSAPPFVSEVKVPSWHTNAFSVQARGTTPRAGLRDSDRAPPLDASLLQQTRSGAILRDPSMEWR